MAKTDAESEQVTCPLCELLDRVRARCDRWRSSRFAQHIRNARMEVLMAVRSLIDERIDELKEEPAPKKASRRIKVKEGK